MRKRVVVYCATGYGARVALSLDDEQYEVLAFADSNQECWGMQQGGDTYRFTEDNIRP